MNSNYQKSLNYMKLITIPQSLDQEHGLGLISTPTIRHIFVIVELKYRPSIVVWVRRRLVGILKYTGKILSLPRQGRNLDPNFEFEFILKWKKMNDNFLISLQCNYNLQ